MAEWLHEAGIGEERAILVNRGAIIAARVVWDEPWRAGAVADARLVIRIPGTRRAVVRLPDGIEAMAEGLDPKLTEGAAVRVRITQANGDSVDQQLRSHGAALPP